MTEVEKIHEIRRLLDEMHDHWRNNANDHHCKSYEGHLTVGLDYDNYFARSERAEKGLPPAPPKVWVEVASYLFSPCGRSTSWPSIDAALAEIREWHADEMMHEYGDSW